MEDLWNAFGQVLDDIDEVLGDAKETSSTARYGYGRVQDSAERFTDIPKNYEVNVKQAASYMDRKRKCKKRTMIFCVFMIIITIVVCIFL